MANPERYQAPAEIVRLKTLALGVGGVALAIWAVGLYFNTEQALRSWLLGFLFWGGIGIGSLGVLMLQYLTGGAWGVVIRRAAEAATRTLPLVFLMFIPLAIGVYTHSFYEWTHLPPTDHVMVQRGIFMTPSMWILRGVVFIGIFYLIARVLNNWSLQQDSAGSVEESRLLLEKMSRFSGPSMVVFCIIVTFAVVDWVMTLDPHWFSTIWGLLYVVGWALGTFCFMIALMAYLIDLAPMNSVLGKRHFHDLGKLMLALVMVWAYFNFSQFLIIWSGNIPEETSFMLVRMKGGWGYIGVALILFHFAFPFLILLQQDFKRRARWISGLAIFVLFMRLLDMFWQIGPTLRVDPNTTIAPGAFHVDWLDFVAPIAVGGIWLWWFFDELTKRPIVPAKDPYFEEAIAHGRGH